MLSVRGGKGSASMSAMPWIGASQVIRCVMSEQDRLGLCRQLGVLDPGIRKGVYHALI